MRVPHLNAGEDRAEPQAVPEHGTCFALSPRPGENIISPDTMHRSQTDRDRDRGFPEHIHGTDRLQRASNSRYSALSYDSFKCRKGTRPHPRLALIDGKFPSLPSSPKVSQNLIMVLIVGTFFCQCDNEPKSPMQRRPKTEPHTSREHIHGMNR